jgi:hypothetical protein
MLITAWIMSRKNIKSRATRTDEMNTQTQAGNRKGFKRNVSFIDYTKHAKCRMACREITETEVRDIMKKGTINYWKSDLNDLPCPTYALEGFTSQDHQHVRIIFAQCDLKTRVVTCIDLDRDYPCHCN